MDGELNRFNRRGLGFKAMSASVAVMCLVGASANIAVAGMLHTVQVEADVYSGRPNPTWELSKADAEKFSAWIISLAAVSPGAGDSAAPSLGYRGLVVTECIDESSKRLRISHGIVASDLRPGDVQRWSDPGGRLEHWLLETGRNALGEELLNYLLRAAQQEK